MKKTLMLLVTASLMIGCLQTQEEKQAYILHGAWVLQHVEYPSGGCDDYYMEGNGTFCFIYDGDSMLYECRIAATSSGMVVVPTAKGSVTLIDKGGGERLYLENNEPHPLTIGDSTITIQNDGILFTLLRADDIYQEWGTEIRDIIAREIDNEDIHQANRYVLSAKERQQERTIHWFVFCSAFIVIAAMIAAHLAITNRKAKMRLQLQLQQIHEVQENRPAAVRQVVATMENNSIKDAIIWVDKTTTKGTWLKRHDIWKKVTLPDKVVKYIVDCCKTKETPADVQQLIKQSMFN